MPNSITGRITFSGKFFTVRDPGQTIKDNIRDYLLEIAREAEADVRAAMRAGESGRRAVRLIERDARVSQYVRGRVQSLSGRPWQYHAVVSPDRTGLSRPAAIALFAAASRIEGREHPFRNVRRATRRGVRDLSRGLE